MCTGSKERGRFGPRAALAGTERAALAEADAYDGFALDLDLHATCDMSPNIMHEELLIVAGGHSCHMSINTLMHESKAQLDIRCHFPHLRQSEMVSERRSIHYVYLWCIYRKYITDYDLTVEEPDLSHDFL